MLEDLTGCIQETRDDYVVCMTCEEVSMDGETGAIIGESEAVLRGWQCTLDGWACPEHELGCWKYCAHLGRWVEVGA